MHWALNDQNFRECKFWESENCNRGSRNSLSKGQRCDKVRVWYTLADSKYSLENEAGELDPPLDWS